MHVHEYMFRSARGVSMPLGRWNGQPILVVNSASESHFAPQLRKLQALHQEYMPAGLVVVAMPCNDYGDREPLEGDALDAHYWETWQVNFPVTERLEIIGRNPHPMFVAMREEYSNEILPTGNFFKYLFGRDGDLLAHWPSEIDPDDPAVHHEIERNVSSWCL